MEAFLAILRLDRHTGPPIGPMVESGMAMVRSSDTRVERFGAPGIAVAVQLRSRAPDSYFGRVADRLYYVQGWVEPQESSSPYSPAHMLAGDKILPPGLLDDPAEAAGLTGSFHVAGYDAETRQLMAIVDRLASRPLFFYQDSQRLILSSDIRAILGVPGVDCSVDLESLTQFVRIQTILGDRTLYQEIRALLPGSALQATTHTPEIQIQRYWSMERLPPFEDEEEAIRGVRDAFLKAGERLARGTELGGILLSGGLDSRLELATMASNLGALEAFTFGPAVTDEGQVAQTVAHIAGVPWRFVGQSASDYWAQLDAVLPTIQAQYSLAHTHPFRTARMMAGSGIDTIYHALELCVTFSGSYLPKEYVHIAGREIYTYRLTPLSSQADVRRSFLTNHDIQRGEFRRSFLREPMRDLWQTATEQTLDRAFVAAAEKWPSPYDWYEKGMLSAGFSKFRSYIVATCNRAVARERSPMSDAGVIDAYLRLSVRQRFLGPTYRRAFELIDPDLAHFVYPNTGVSPFAPPLVQALSLQARQFGRANRERLRRVFGSLGLRALLQAKFYGSYPSPAKLAQVLALGSLPTTAATRNALTDGFLAQSGIVDAGRLRERLDEGDFTDSSEALTILALASLAAWFEKHPAGTGVQAT
jgi:asparagine synthase (glutamine-hydrolysing)